MTLEDFEKSLAEEKNSKKQSSDHSHSRSQKRRKHHHRDHHIDDQEQHRCKRSRQSEDANDDEGGQSRIYTENKGPENDKSRRREEDEWVEKTNNSSMQTESPRNLSLSKASHHLKRDSWMEAPSHSEVEFKQRATHKGSDPVAVGSLKADFELKIHENELNKHHLQDLAAGREPVNSVPDGSSCRAVKYVFGDAGAQWRMTKLKAVFRQAAEERRPTDDVAIERFDDLREFDNAREEQIELERRETYGKGYSRKEKPSGKLFLERKLDTEVHSKSPETSKLGAIPRNEESQTYETVLLEKLKAPMDQTGLNRLKAQMLKAKLRGANDAPVLEADYAKAVELYGKSQSSGLVVLGAMENRMLASGRNGEVIGINSKRGRERGLVEVNEDMSVEDMVREERRTRNQAGGDGKLFAERIAKDGKFDVISTILYSMWKG